MIKKLETQRQKDVARTMKEHREGQKSKLKAWLSGRVVSGKSGKK